jgi:energy-coupling factor transport system ATP-binding protein
MNKIYLDHVSYVYSRGTPYEQVALDDVSVGIREGCITGIIGHTGSGKSTMMQMLNGLIKPDSGKVLLDGYDINSTVDDVYDAWSEREEYAALSPRKRKKKMQREIRERKSKLCFRVGLVMQYPEYQLFEETVYADIAFGPRNMGLDEEEIRARVLEAAAFCDIGEELLEKSPFDLSGGQKRRVALAGVIAMRPEVLILDFSAVKFMDSSGIGLILGRCELCASLGIDVRIEGMSKTQKRLIYLSGIERVKNLTVV